jgi:HEAT repeat protein
MSRPNPYKLFDYYTEEDADVFFGREAEISAVVGDILANKLLVLFAPSGSGKTSLLNAGIAPALRDLGTVDENDPGIHMVTIRLSADITPEESALRALRNALPVKPSPGQSLHNFLEATCSIRKPQDKATPDTLPTPPLGIVLVFDQFEELFISLFKDHPDVRAEFADKLAKIIYDENLRAYVVLSLRSDHFHHLSEFRSVIPSIFQNNTNLELRPFERAAALRVIEGPAQRKESGFSWEPGLPERIVHDLEKLSGERDRVFPLHLQIVCYDLFERLDQGKGLITTAHYKQATEALGQTGKTPAAAMIHNRIIGPLEGIGGRARRRQLYRMLRELMTAQGAKFPRTFTELRRVIPKKYLLPLLEQLEKKSLLRHMTAAAGETYYELRHDYLARTIAPWLDAQEAKFRTGDLQRRIALVTVLVLLAVAVYKLGRDWFTYTASFGPDSKRPSELLLNRKDTIGRFTPSWWKREISSGYAKKQLLAANLPRHSFTVSKALWNWKDIEDQLNERERWALQLATRLDGKGSSEAILFETIRYPDIEFFMIADQSIMDHVLSGLKDGDPTAQLSSIEALGRLGGKLPQPRIDPVVGALVAELQNSPNADVKSSIISELGRLGMNLPGDRVATVIDPLLTKLEDPDAKIKGAAISVLPNLAGKLKEEHLAPAVDALFNALKGADSAIADSAITALSTLGEELPQERMRVFVDALLRGLRASDSRVKVVAITLLGSLGGRFAPGDRTKDAVEDLRFLLDHSDPGVAQAAIEALGNLGGQLSPEQVGPVGPVVAALLSAFNGRLEASVRGAAGEALGRLGAKLEADQIAPVVGALFTGLRDPDPQVRSLVGSALGQLGKELPHERMNAFVDMLLRASKDPNSEIKRSSVGALGRVGKNLPPELDAAVIKALISALKDPDANIKRSAASALARLGNELTQDRIGPFVKALLPLVKDPDSEIKDSAVSALGEWGDKLPPEQTDAVVTSLVSALDDPDTAIKNTAVSALGKLAAKLPENRTAPIVDALLGACMNPEFGIRTSAALALGNLAARLPENRIPPIVQALLKGVKDATNKSTAGEALDLFCEKVPTERMRGVVEPLLLALKDPDSGVQSFTLSALGRCAANLSPEQVPAVLEGLFKALKAEDSSVQSAAFFIVGDFKDKLPPERVPDVVDTLLAGVNSANRTVKRSAISGLRGLAEKLGDRVGATVKALFNALMDPDAGVHVLAENALEDFRKKLPQAQIASFVDALLSASRESDLAVKNSAFAILGRLGEKVPPDQMPTVVDALLNAVPDSNIRVKITAISTLAQLGKKIPQDRTSVVVEALLGTLRAPKSPMQVKDSAVEALGIVASRTISKGGPSVFLDLDLEADEGGGKSAEAIRSLASAEWALSDRDLVNCLQSDDSRWRSFAIHVLGGRQPPPEIRERIIAFRHDPKGRPWVKMAALRCLVEIEREKLALQAEQERTEPEATAAESPEAP